MKCKLYYLPLAFAVGWTLGAGLLITAAAVIVNSEKKRRGPQWRP